MYSDHGNGMSCFHCDNCHCQFGVNCLDVEEDMSCPRCASEDVTWTEERLVGQYVREYESVEHWESEKPPDIYKKINIGGSEWVIVRG